MYIFYIIVKSMVFPVVMYRCESWAIKKAEHQSVSVIVVLHSTSDSFKCDVVMLLKSVQCEVKVFFTD